MSLVRSTSRPSAFSLLVAITLVSLTGCGMQLGGRPRPSADGHGQEGRPALSESDRERVAAYVKTIRAKWSSDTFTDERLDELEKETIVAFKEALGKAAAHGGEAPMPSSASITALRASPIKLRVEPIRDRDGKVVKSTFVGVEDSYSERMRKLQRKVVEQTLTPGETAEIQNGSKYLMKVNDVRMSVMDMSTAAFKANGIVSTTANANILTVQALTQVMSSFEMSSGPEDRAVVKSLLARQKRAEALAAATLGMIATFQAVINDGKNPKALDAIAEASLKTFPIQVKVSDEEADAFLEAWRTAPPRTRERYETELRKKHGDAEYDRSYKANVESMFAGAPVPPAALAARNTAAAVAAKDAPGALDAAAKAFPGDGTIRSSLEGAAALSRGDTKGALKAALDLVPGGGLVKDGLGLATKLLFPG